MTPDGKTTHLSNLEMFRPDGFFDGDRIRLRRRSRAAAAADRRPKSVENAAQREFLHC